MIKQVASRKISRLSVIGVFTFVFGVLFNTACSQVVTNECGTITIPEEWSQTIEFSWPFSVAIYEIKENKTICDGTLISKRHVLTAANCFQNENRTLTYGPTEISVVLGTGVAHDNITEILFHPDWELFYKTNPDADVAILVLENEVTLSNDIQIVCLPVEEDIMQSGVGVLVGSDFTITNYTKSAVGVGRDVTTKSGTGSVVAQDDTTKNRTGSVVAANDTTKNETGSVIAANDSTKNETGSVIAPVDTTKNETGSVIAPVDTTKNETGSVIAPVDTTKNETGSVIAPVDTTKNETGSVIAPVDTTKNGTGSVVATNDTIKNGTGSVVATNDSTKNETGSVIVPFDTPKNQTGSVIAPVDTTKNETGSVIAPFDTTKNETGSVIAPVDTTKNSTGSLVIMNSTVKNGTVYVIGPNRTIDDSTAFVVGWDDVSVPGLVSFIKYIEKYGARRYGTIRDGRFVVRWEMVQRISLINVFNSSECNKENFPRIFCGRTGRTWPSTRVSGGGFFTFTDNAWVQHGIAVSIRNTTINSTEHSIVSLTSGTSFKNWIGRVVSESGEAIGEATIGKINLTCDFSHLYSGYACVAYGLEVTNRNFVVEKLVGAHQPKKNNRDVEFIQFHSGTMKHLLNGIGKLFPNLKSVLVGYSDSMSLNTVFIRRCNFQHMENVFEIVIHKSSIETVPDDLLWDLPNLERFQLDGKLIEIPERLFERNLKLQEVYLASNELTFLPRALFRRNLDLKWVNFEQNRLQFIEVDFMFLPNIQYVFLADNICIDRYLNKAEETDEDQFVAPKEIDNSVPLKSVSKLQRLIYSNCSFYG